MARSQLQSSGGALRGEELGKFEVWILWNLTPGEQRLWEFKPKPDNKKNYTQPEQGILWLALTVKQLAWVEPVAETGTNSVALDFYTVVQWEQQETMNYFQNMV